MAGFGDEIGRWRLALRAEKLEKGQRVAVLMPNGIEHVAMDQAALSLVPAPMHALIPNCYSGSSEGVHIKEWVPCR